MPEAGCFEVKIGGQDLTQSPQRGAEKRRASWHHMEHDNRLAVRTMVSSAARAATEWIKAAQRKLTSRLQVDVCVAKQMIQPLSGLLQITGLQPRVAKQDSRASQPDLA